MLNFILPKKTSFLVTIAFFKLTQLKQSWLPEKKYYQ